MPTKIDFYQERDLELSSLPDFKRSEFVNEHPIDVFSNYLGEINLKKYNDINIFMPMAYSEKGKPYVVNEVGIPNNTYNYIEISEYIPESGLLVGQSLEDLMIDDKIKINSEVNFENLFKPEEIVSDFVRTYIHFFKEVGKMIITSGEYPMRTVEKNYFYRGNKFNESPTGIEKQLYDILLLSRVILDEPNLKFTDLEKYDWKKKE